MNLQRLRIVALCASFEQILYVTHAGQLSTQQYEFRFELETLLDISQRLIVVHVAEDHLRLGDLVHVGHSLYKRNRVY